MSKGITLIAPYKELADLSRVVCDDLDIKAKVLIGDLDEGVDLAKKAVVEGAEVIISRGGTATEIAKEIDIPVVEIEVGGFDLVRAVGNAKMFSNKIGVVGFSNIVYGAKSLEKTLEVEISELVVNSAKEVPVAIAKAMDLGVEVIIGDAVSVRWGDELGL